MSVLAACAGVSARAAAAAVNAPVNAPVNALALAEAEARTLLQERAEQARWIAPQFELSALDATPGRRSEAPLSCAQPVSVEPLETRFVTRMKWAVICADANGWRREVVVKARVSAQVLVMGEDVPAGQAIAAEQLRLERRDVSATPDALSDTEAAVGRTGRSTLHTGQMLAKRLLLAPLWVQRGQSVGIQASHAGIVVTVPGEALEAGREGDTIRVRNTRSGKVIRARVIDAGVVEPQAMGASTSDQSRPERD